MMSSSSFHAVPAKLIEYIIYMRSRLLLLTIDTRGSVTIICSQSEIQHSRDEDFQFLLLLLSPTHHTCLEINCEHVLDLQWPHSEGTR